MRPGSRAGLLHVEVEHCRIVDRARAVCDGWHVTNRPNGSVFAQIADDVGPLARCRSASAARSKGRRASWSSPAAHQTTGQAPQRAMSSRQCRCMFSAPQPRQVVAPGADDAGHNPLVDEIGCGGPRR